MLLLAAPLMLAFMPPEWSNCGWIRSTTTRPTPRPRGGSMPGAWRGTWRATAFSAAASTSTEPAVFAIYAPDPTDVHAAHSIYFQVLGEHGFVGLGLYLLLGVLTWRDAAWIIAHAAAVRRLALGRRPGRDDPDQPGRLRGRRRLPQPGLFRRAVLPGRHPGGDPRAGRAAPAATCSWRECRHERSSGRCRSWSTTGCWRAPTRCSRTGRRAPLRTAAAPAEPLVHA